jgi:hypothetical protein
MFSTQLCGYLESQHATLAISKEENLAMLILTLLDKDLLDQVIEHKLRAFRESCVSIDGAIVIEDDVVPPVAC